eukprot:TRINITY_DN870_c0_g1_i12.p1 TRINITY_DN870_c0_g1~~TRINITY_DN870_c0_g1_i12.p1  ORF type:complete len:1414 (-),score=509.47 TRINITY_DN870_c0_g1_i12:580-4821(-)
MSRFDAASAKAKGKAAPKVAASKTAAAPKPAAKPAANPILKTLDDKKKWTKTHEAKIDDAQEAVNDEPNKAKKKELEAKLKKMKEDEFYVKTKQDIKDAEAQAIKDAERAALNRKAEEKKTSKETTEKASNDAASAVQADDAMMKEIDTLLADKKQQAEGIQKLQSVAGCTPFVLPRFEKLIPFFADSKLGAPAVKCAIAIAEGCQPDGHGIASVIAPAILNGMEDKKWKTKAGCIEVFLPALRVMEKSTPAQLGEVLPKMVPKLAEAALEVRAEIRTATKNVLNEIGSLVSSPEIKKLSKDLVTALSEPTNQKHTQDVLARMGNQTFLSLIDAASLSLLMPVVVRGLKERDSMSKKWSAQIFGSTSMLVADVETMRPFLVTIVPLLQSALADPVAEVVREAAKAFGTIEHVLPEYSRHHTLPWLFDKLRNGQLGEQLGASLAIAEVFLKMEKTKSEALMPEVHAAALSDKAGTRRGFLELMDAMPNAMKMDFVPYLKDLFPVMMMGITGDKEKEEDAGLKASLSLVGRYGNLCPDLLVGAFEQVFAATLYADTPEERNRQTAVRDKACMLLGKVIDKVLEYKQFGQDLLTTSECSNKTTREYLMVLVFIMRWDGDASVKRYANGAWKTAGGAPKVQKQIMPAVEKLLKRMRSGELGLGMQKLAAKVYEELVKGEEIEAPTGEEGAAVKFELKPPVGRLEGSDAEKIVNGQSPANKESTELEFVRQSSGGCLVKDMLEETAGFCDLAEDVRAHCLSVIKSVVTELRKKKMAGPKMAEKVAEAIKAVVILAGAEPNADTTTLVSESATRHLLGDLYDTLGSGSGDGDEEAILDVEGLLLMYGAGHLLLKDTTLCMKKNHRYGVVGQNGAGKTTLMKEIVGHRIVGMPEDIKCVHVDDSKLSLMSKSSLTCLEYCIKMALDIGVDNAGKDTLLAVGFPENKLNDPVSELSTGWRMRLTLAVNMLKHADLVLLDEPTNHLDEQSVEWLGDYILSIHNSSVMVISHEPKFLDKICTDIIAYVDKKLEYTKGSFTTFAANKGLTKEQIDAMLSGNLSFDTKNGDEDEEEDPDAVKKPVAGPPKLSFPIPGAMEGVKSSSKAVLEAKNISFRWSKEKEYLIQDCSVKLSLNARVAICGRNGCGKSTLMTLLCSEMSPSENKDGSLGEVSRHCNLRLAYMKQDHLKALADFFDTSPFVYITTRFKNGYDGDLQKRLIDPEDQDEADRRKALAKEHGKYGLQVQTLVSRTKVGSQLAYEIQWDGLEDPKQNTIEPISKLRMMGLDKVVIACDERIAAKAAGLDQRPLTRREVVRHCEAFGIDEEMCCNRQIRGFSAGQKVRLSLAAMFWTRPHLIAVDEPTNYLDVETVEALAKALCTFRGGIVMIEPKSDFVERICNEKWHLEDAKVTVEKLANGAKRQA